MTTEKSRPIPIIIPDPLIYAADLVASKQQTDRSIILKKWLYTGATDDVLDLLAQGEISKGYAVTVLDSCYDAVNEMLASRGIRVGPTKEQAEASREVAKALTLKPKTGS